MLGGSRQPKEAQLTDLHPWPELDRQRGNIR
jgi:hypothetical protein